MCLEQFHNLRHNRKVRTHMLYEYTNFIQFLVTRYLLISYKNINYSYQDIFIVISLINNITNSLHYYSQNSLQYNAEKRIKSN